MMKFSHLVLAASLFLLSSVSAFADGKTVVQAVNYPLYYFAERLATAEFELHYIVDPEEDPAFWEPNEEEIAAFQKADLVLKNGAEYEKWMKTVSMRTASLVDTSKSFAKDYIVTEGVEHSHGDGTVHSHAGTVFTTWIDFAQAAKQAEAIAARFKVVRPDSAAEIESNLSSLLADLSSLDQRMLAFGKAWGDEPLVASHPIYHYFARAYGLKIESLEWEPDMEMKDSDLAAMKAILAKHPAKWIIWEDEPTQANVDAVATIGLKGVVMSPAANRPSEGDWLSVMKANVSNFEAMLEGK